MTRFAVLIDQPLGEALPRWHETLFDLSGEFLKQHPQHSEAPHVDLSLSRPLDDSSPERNVHTLAPRRMLRAHAAGTSQELGRPPVVVVLRNELKPLLLPEDCSEVNINLIVRNCLLHGIVRDGSERVDRRQLDQPEAREPYEQCGRQLAGKKGVADNLAELRPRRFVIVCS
jgi:hypothetical protein